MIPLRRYNKRIALYASSSVNRGGTGVYTRRLINGFKAIGIEEVIPVGLNTGSAAGKLFSEHFSLPRRVGKEGFDLLHLPAFGGNTTGDIPYAVTVHDMAFMARPKWFPLLRSMYYRLHFPKVASGASLVIADSDFTVTEIKKYLNLDASRVYLSAPPNTSDDLLFRKSYGVTGKYILATSTIEPRKNTDALLEAWPSIRKVHPDLTLVIAGRWGWGRKETKLALMNTPGVRWVNSIPDSELMSAFSGSSLLVYPSLYEGFGLPPLESAAAGVPFVIGPAETLKEIYGSVASAISDKSAASIAEAVLNALEKPVNKFELKEFASGFSDEQMARNTYAAYGKVFE